MPSFIASDLWFLRFRDHFASEWCLAFLKIDLTSILHVMLMNLNLNSVSIQSVVVRTICIISWGPNETLSKVVLGYCASLPVSKYNSKLTAYGCKLLVLRHVLKHLCCH